MQKLVAEPRSSQCHPLSLGWVISFSRHGKTWENPSCCYGHLFHLHQRSTEGRACSNFLSEQKKQLIPAPWPWRSDYRPPLCSNLSVVLAQWPYASSQSCLFYATEHRGSFSFLLKLPRPQTLLTPKMVSRYLFSDIKYSTCTERRQDRIIWKAKH